MRDIDLNTEREEQDMVVTAHGKRRNGVLSITLQSGGMVCVLSALPETEPEQLADFIALIPENIGQTMKAMAEKAEGTHA